MTSSSPQAVPLEDSSASQVIEEHVVKSSGEVTIRRYTKGRLLGKGGFARCYEFTALDTKKAMAAKIVVKASLTKSRQKQKLMSEIKIHRSLSHGNVVGFEHFFEDTENVYILLELCKNQTMSELIRRRKRLSEIEVQCYCHQIISALKYLHAHRVIHRDLKLGNLFLSDRMEIKLGDFGLATKLEFDGEKKRTICGTPNYIAPEVLEGKTGHSYEVDVWSLGVVIYTLLIGKPPFETADVKTTYRRIKMNAYTFPDTLPISDSAKGLITRMLVNDPTKRPSFDTILEHDFFHQGNSIPKLMPASTMACPPSTTFMQKYAPNSVAQQPPQRLADTVPASIPGMQTAATSQPGSRTRKHDLITTDRTPRVPSEKLLKTQEREVDPPAASSDKRRSPPSQATAGNGGVEVWVKKWVDYSSKYGLGYLLSNGFTGVLFNDSTKVVSSPDGQTFGYMDRKGPDKQEIIQMYTINDFPKDLQKKVTLMHHFRSYLEPDSKIDSPSSVSPLIYVKKWMRTRHAILFRLSNKIVQVNFQDRTEIILSSESKTVTYVSKLGERSTHPLASAMDSANIEMSKRLKYTKDILTHMMTARAGTGTTSNRRASPRLPEDEK